MNFKAVNDKLIVEEFTLEKNDKGFLIVEDGSLARGKVLSVGESKEISKDDVVVYRKAAVKPLGFDNDNNIKYLSLEDVVAVEVETDETEVETDE